MQSKVKRSKTKRSNKKIIIKQCKVDKGKTKHKGEDQMLTFVLTRRLTFLTCSTSCGDRLVNTYLMELISGTEFMRGAYWASLFSNQKEIPSQDRSKDLAIVHREK